MARRQVDEENLAQAQSRVLRSGVLGDGRGELLARGPLLALLEGGIHAVVAKYAAGESGHGHTCTSDGIRTPQGAHHGRAQLGPNDIEDPLVRHVV